MVDKQTERILSEAGRSLLSDVPLSMVLTDPYRKDNPIIYVNRAFETTTGYSSQYAVGKNCRFLQNGHDDQEGVRELRRAVEREDPTSVELKNFTADGEPFNNRLTITPLRDDNGELYAFLGIQIRVRDDNSALKLSERLEETEHRVKNHLQMVASLIRSQSRDADPHEAYGMLSRRVEALALLYEDFQRPPAAHRGGLYDVVSAGAYVGRVASTIGSLDGRNGVRLNVDTDPVYMPAARAAQLGLLVSEILSNALQHAFADREEGVVEIRLKEMGEDRFRLTVSDDGVGLGDAGWPDSDGMGARIVRNMVKGIGAQLGVASSNMGTTVRIDFENDLSSKIEDSTGDRKRVGDGKDESAGEGESEGEGEPVKADA